MRLLKSPSQAHLRAVRSLFCSSLLIPPALGRVRSVNTERASAGRCRESWRWSGEGGRRTSRQLPTGEASLALPAGCRGVLSPSPAAAGFGPGALPASTSWQASPSSSFHFSSLVSIVLLFGELESMIAFETRLALASDATGWVFFSFQIGLSLSTSSPGQLEGSAALP